VRTWRLCAERGQRWLWSGVESGVEGSDKNIGIGRLGVCWTCGLHCTRCGSTVGRFDRVVDVGVHNGYRAMDDWTLLGWCAW
jgi:hypothetical protein